MPKRYTSRELVKLAKNLGWTQVGVSEEVMEYLILLEPTEAGFAVQVPDLAVVTYGKDVGAAKRAAIEAIRVNLEAYREAGRQVPEKKPVTSHLENPEFRDLLFTYVDVVEPEDRIAA